MSSALRCTKCGDTDGPFTRKGLCEDCDDKQQPAE